MSVPNVDRVWYAAYGSNLLRERFLLYLRGGRFRGGGQPHGGARDDADPQSDRIIEVDHQMHFGRHSSRWNGGVSFLDPTPGGSAFVRCWSVTLEQFADIAAQENGREAGTLDVDLDRLVSDGHADLTDRWYGKGLLLGHLEGAPVVTFTTPTLVEPTAPGEMYLMVILQGLVETGSSPESAVGYVLTCPGVPTAWSREQLLALAVGR